MRFETLTLNLEEYRSRQFLPPGLEVKEERNLFTGQMLLDMKMGVWGYNDTALPYTEPASWWQHFKRDVFPEWLLARFPVINKQRCVPLRVRFPTLRLEGFKHRARVEIVKF